jgi:hypothetical protein
MDVKWRVFVLRAGLFPDQPRMVATAKLAGLHASLKLIAAELIASARSASLVLAIFSRAASIGFAAGFCRTALRGGALCAGRQQDQREQNQKKLEDYF